MTMASIDPATWPPWNLANLIWLHGRALYFHHDYLSKLAGNLPKELQQVHIRTTSLSFSLLELGEVLREKRFQVLDTDHKNSREILQMVEVVAAALFEIIRGVYKLRELPEATILDSIRSYVGLPTPLDDWKTEKERLMSETSEISSSLADFNHVVTASTAKKASGICDRLERLEESVKQRTSWLAELFGGRLARRKPKSIDRADRDDHLTLADLKERARAYVENLCKANETYRWYRFLNNTKAVILVGEVTDVDNIIAIALWSAENGGEAEFYQGMYLGTIHTVFTSGQREIQLAFRNTQHAYSLRDLIDNHKILLAGHISSVQSRLHDARNRRYSRLTDFSPSESEGNATCIAEVLEFEIWTTTDADGEELSLETTRALQLWPHRFDAGRDFIYIQVSYQTGYKVSDRTLELSCAKISKTKNGVDNLHGNFDIDSIELEGDFKIQFKDPQGAKKVYDLLTTNRISSDEDY